MYTVNFLKGEENGNYLFQKIAFMIDWVKR